MSKSFRCQGLCFTFSTATGRYEADLIQAQKLKKGIDTVESCAYAAQHQLLDLDAQQTQPAASTPFSTAFNIAWLLGIANRMSTAPLMRMKSPSADPSNTTAHPPAV